MKATGERRGVERDPSPRGHDALHGSARSIAGVVAFVGTLLGIVFVLWPSLQPEGHPQTQSVTTDNLTLDRKVTFGQYLERIAESRAPYGSDKLARQGVLVEFDYFIQGYRYAQLPLRWQLIDADSGEQLDQLRSVFIIPQATNDKGTWHVWVPTPKRRFRRLFVQIQLYDRPGGVPLGGRLRTQSFPSAPTR